MNNSQSNEQNVKPEFGIQRIYIKDISFEAPNAPDVFRSEWKPEVDLNLNTLSQKLEDNVYEVILKVTVTAKNDEKVAYLTEVQQAGVFTLPEVTEDQLKGILNSFCPNILFPYLRETVANLVDRGSFPPLHLAPINFDLLYARHLEQQNGSGAETASAENQTH